ncbi:hypothetical protein [Flammeovirga kamogawensis]|uniref:PH domain-containing protein n=1 Tax=Flammeovirga kamogawensis TaxID=373891 RepID=A0ABX8H1Q6_9BACT|nr:hypothetical protein [Flammeovirga kamogawensis]MBB6464146.1 hypothetical protein [Flammeovirga kamogawensis]QWG09247.1 hypothetical protein KM029_21825 [Flammeovirga kamogawensis]TRX64772.1 hypothetical protein EO216_19735 [Flammeovirga kamogawensis]
MNKIFYKTHPRLFILSITFLGFIFFSELNLLIFFKSEGDFNLMIVSLIIVFTILPLVSLYYLLKIKIIKLGHKEIIISNFFLPFSRSINFNEIMKMEQKSKRIKSNYGGSVQTKYLYTEVKTLIYLTNNKRVILNSISESEFGELQTIYLKLKRSEGKIKPRNNSIIYYLLDSLDGLIWIIISIFLTIGLGFSLFDQALKH